MYELLIVSGEESRGSGRCGEPLNISSARGAHTTDTKEAEGPNDKTVSGTGTNDPSNTSTTASYDTNTEMDKVQYITLI